MHLMKKASLLILLCCISGIIHASARVEKIEPTDWFVGLKNTKLQLFLYGKDIKNSNVSITYPGVNIDSIVRLKSPNYLLLYIDLKSAKPGKMPIILTQHKQRSVYNYTLRNREKDGCQRKGFDNADVLYMLMPDRFANGDPHNDQIKGMRPYKCDRSQPSLRHGGDLEGIRKHLDYFRDLGVTTLWFTPVLENNSPDDGPNSTYHGYATTDYYKVDPRFGTNAQYKTLTDEAHQKGLKIVMDMIFNHCGFDHPWVKDMPSDDWFNAPQWLHTDTGNDTPSRKPQPNGPYLQTSYILTPVLDPYASQTDLNKTVNGWFVPSMPDLNQRNPHLMQYLIQNSIWWIETIGIDGIRMDTYPYADRNAMRSWMQRLQEEYPYFNTVGEIWVTQPAYTAAWQKDSKLTSTDSRLKTVMDFGFYENINQIKNEDTDDYFTGRGLNRIYNLLAYDYLYKKPESVMAFIDNHDTDRFLGEGYDMKSLKQALAILLTIKRIPQIYYGTEILINGTKRVTDGHVRKDYPGGFPGDKCNAFDAKQRSKDQNQMYDWLKTLLHWRKGNLLIIKGKQVHFIPQNGIYVIARTYDDKTSLTILNGSNQPQTIDFGYYKEVIGEQHVYEDIHTKAIINTNNPLIIAPKECLIIQSK